MNGRKLPVVPSRTAAGTQAYASMLDLHSAVLDAGTTCSDVVLQPATTAKSQAGCDLGGGRSLVLQTWRDSAGRGQGARATAATLAARNVPWCVLEGSGGTGLWTVSFSGDATVCAGLARHLGGTVTRSAGAQG